MLGKRSASLLQSLTLLTSVLLTAPAAAQPAGDPEDLVSAAAAAQPAGDPEGLDPTFAELSATDQFEKVLLTPDVPEPMSMDIAADGRVFMTSRDGVIRIYHPDTEQVTVAAELSVFDDHPLPPNPDFEGSKNNEGGLLGLALDPDFETNGWVYVYYTSRDENNHFLSRFVVEDNELDVASEIVMLKVPYNKTHCCHVAGDLEFDSAGNLYLSTGDESPPDLNQQYSPLDSRPTHWYNDDRRTSGNTNDLRGKILRIAPQPDGTYTIPEGNLFPPGSHDPNLIRPEIYAMGFRNPFRISIDPATDRLHIGNYGPDRLGEWTERGPWGFDQYMVTSEPANFGYPYCIGNNYPYRPWDYVTNQPLGDFYDCDNGPTNDSPNNTGLEQLPPVKPAAIYYPRSWEGWPETWVGWPGRQINPIPEPFLNMGTGAGGPMSGPVYRYDENLESETKFPEHYDGRWFLLDFHRGHVKTAVLDENETVTAIDDFLPGETWAGLMDGEFGPDGSLYVLEGGSFGPNDNAGLYRVDYVSSDAPECAAQPVEDGYQALWDGSTLDGWNQAGPGGFAIVPDEDRAGTCALESVGDPAGLGLLWHEEEFESYRLHVDFKAVAPEDNSGVFFGFPDPGDDPWVAVNQGYEIQIDDTGGSPGAPDSSKTGSVYTFQAPTSFPTVAGEWNTMEIEVDDPMVRVWINDVLVNEYENPAGSGRDLSSGYVGIQNNRVSDNVFFRDIWIQELGTEPCPEPQSPPAGYVSLFDGETLNGWTHIGPGGFEVDECGLLQPHGGMGLLWYHERTFDDFVMRVDFRVHNPTDNSGVFVRFPDPQGDPWNPVDEGYEVQIYEATDDPLTRTGAIYSFAPAEPLATNPVGEWNTMEIEAIGQEYRVTLNGVVVTTYTGDGSRPLEGYVGIQNHAEGQAAGENVEFRNVWINEDPGELTVDASLDPADPNGDNGWYVSPVTLTLESNNPDAVLQWRPRTDESEWRTWTEPVVFDVDGIHNIDYRAVLPGDSEPAEKEILVGQDGFSFSETEFSVEQGDVIKFQYVPGHAHDVVVTDENGVVLASRPVGSDWEDDPFYFEAADQGTFYVYCTPHSNRPDPDDPTTWTGMVSTFEVTPSSGSGEETGIEEIEFLIDQTAPATEASLAGDKVGDLFTGPVTVTLDAQDATSGIAQTHYRMAGDEDPTVYDEPVTVTDPGPHTVEFRSVDQAGNVEDWQSVEFTIGEPGPCPNPDPRETVVVGTVDSGVRSYPLDNGCTVNDLILDSQPWPSRGAFLRHVQEVTDQLRSDGVITRQEANAIIRAAAESDVGRLAESHAGHLGDPYPL